MNIRRAIRAATVSELIMIEPGVYQRRYALSSDFSGFQGHFPGYPLLPAFIQILMALILIEDQKKAPLELMELAKAKFLLEIRPNQEIVVQCAEHPHPTALSYEARLMIPKGLASSFKLRLGP